MKYIVYKTTCLINNKIYIGVHKTEKLNRYSLDGIYIDSFTTISNAKEKLNLKLSSISSAIKLNRQCNGFLWTRSDNPPQTISIKIPNNNNIN